MGVLEQKQSELNKLFAATGVDLAYVFGSYAARQTGPESDIDIAILLSPKLSKKERFQIRLEMLSKLGQIVGRMLDLVVINDTPSLFFKYVIIKEGKLIYQISEAKRLDFEIAVLNSYFDFQPFSDAYNQNYVKNNLQ